MQFFGFTLAFIVEFASLLFSASPLFLALFLIIAGRSMLIGRWEGWSTADSLYFGFITGLTVGYGDMRPGSGKSKALAILIAFLGLILTGLMVALAVEAAGVVYDARVEVL